MTGSKQGARKVLVVEDEELIRTLLFGFLTSAGYVVVSTGQPREALDLARRESPDLVISRHLDAGDGRLRGPARAPVRPHDRARARGLPDRPPRVHRAGPGLSLRRRRLHHQALQPRRPRAAGGAGLRGPRLATRHPGAAGRRRLGAPAPPRGEEGVPDRPPLLDRIGRRDARGHRRRKDRRVDAVRAGRSRARVVSRARPRSRADRRPCPDPPARRRGPPPAHRVAPGGLPHRAPGRRQRRPSAPS